MRKENKLFLIVCVAALIGIIATVSIEKTLGVEEFQNTFEEVSCSK